MKRMQSPSSMNTYYQCPRKYYYIYNLKLATKPSIHLTRGVIAHSCLEHFFMLLPETIGQSFEYELNIIINSMLDKFWAKHADELNSLKMPKDELEKYYFETKDMINKWFASFIIKLKDTIENKKLTFNQAWNLIKPETEADYRDEELMVRGYIDAIENVDGEIRLMDYKTSKRPKISPEYKLQLGIYALMYERKHKARPNKVGIYFLKHGEEILEVNDDLINHAKFKLEQIHLETSLSDDIAAYPMNQTPLCKWRTGQCDFYEYCFGSKVPPTPTFLKSSGAIIFRKNNSIVNNPNKEFEYLLLRHKNGNHFSFPKGKIENNEELIETAKREIKEETNLSVEFIDNFQEINSYSPESLIFKKVTYFLAENKSNQKVKIQEEEIEEFKWVSYENAINEITYDTDKEILKKAHAFLLKN